MAILPRVGRRSLRLRAVIIGIYALLTVGGVTMVVPFLIMVTTSISNDTDSDRREVLPSYFWDRDLRSAKYLAERYAFVSFHHFAAAHGPPTEWSSYRHLGFAPDLGRDLRTAELAARPIEQLQRISQDYAEFMETHDPLNTLPVFSRWSQPAVERHMRAKYRQQVSAEQSGSPSSARLDREIGE